MRRSLPASDSPCTRRSFIVGALTTGFALAVRPVSGATIATSSDGLAAGAVKIPVAEGALPAYRARPQTGERFPTVVVVHRLETVGGACTIGSGATASLGAHTSHKQD